MLSLIGLAERCQGRRALFDVFFISKRMRAAVHFHIYKTVTRSMCKNNTQAQNVLGAFEE